MLEAAIAAIAAFVWGFRRGDFAVARYVLMAAIAAALAVVLWAGMQAASGLFAPPASAIPVAAIKYFAALAGGFSLGAYLKRLRVSRDDEIG